MNLKQIIAGTAVVAAGTLAVAGPAAARPLEGGGTERPSCSGLARFIVEAESGHALRKAHAIIGLSGPGADETFARIQLAVSETCS